MAKLDQVIQSFRTEIGPELMMTMIVGVDGISIVGGSTTPAPGASGAEVESEASARMSIIMKLAEKVSFKLGVGKVDDELVTTNTGYVILRTLGSGTYFWSVVIARTATLGTVRMVMNEYAPKLWDAIPS